MRRVSAALIATIAFAACVDEQVTEPVPSFAADAADRTPGGISLEKIGTFDGGGPLAAEITAYDVVSKRLFVVNGALGSVDVVDLRDPSNPQRLETLHAGGGVNSVAAHQGLVALAVEAPVRQNPGRVVFIRATTLQEIGSVQVGPLPDMLTFTPDGHYVVVANEGEPNDAYTVDPEGSISIIDVRNINRPVVRTADFRAWIGREAELRAQGIRIFGPGANAAQDLEPEYVAVSPDSRTAYVTLQENNAVAVVDIVAATVTRLMPLGWKDHSQPGNGMDVSEDGVPLIRTWPVRGLYLPDAIAAWDVGGQTFLITANEGDAREYAGFPAGEEPVRVSSGSVVLNPATFSDAVCHGAPCKANTRMGRLQVVRGMGLNPSTNQYDALYSFGARSVSIWTAQGTQVWDSGDEIERRTQAIPGVAFNANNTSAGNIVDARSGNKGPEPEGVVVGRLGAKTFAFVGLERVGGVMVWDVSNPHAPRYETYINTRTGGSDDRGPEGLIFVPAVQSPDKHPLIIVGNETSGTTAIYRIHLN